MLLDSNSPPPASCSLGKEISKSPRHSLSRKVHVGNLEGSPRSETKCNFRQYRCMSTALPRTVDGRFARKMFSSRASNVGGQRQLDASSDLK